VGRKLPYFFRPHEEHAFLKACEDNLRNHAIFKTLFDSGMRISELVGDKRTGYQGLYVEDINLNSSDGMTYEVRVFGKGKKERMILVSKQAIDEILKWLGNRHSGKIFDITPRQMQKLAKKYAKEAGLPDWNKRGRWSPHKCRHTHATKIVEKGGRDALVVAQEQLGHEGLGGTSVYLHTSTEYRKSVMHKVFGES